MEKRNNKVAIVSFSLGSGGAERFGGLLSCVLTNLGYDVHNIIINDNVDYEFCGELYNLGRICKNDNFISKKIQKGLLLRRYLKDQQINTIIDNRSRNVFIRELLTKWIYGKRQAYYIVHSFNLKDYFPDTPFLANILYRDAAKLICVSKAIEAKVIQKYGFRNTTTIYNPVDVDLKAPIPLIGDKSIIYFGRFQDNVKNLSLMLEAFSSSRVFEKGFKLLLMGDGPDQDYIFNTIAKLGMQDYIIIIPFHKNPYGYVRSAKFTLLTSHFEGFPMSLIESLACGTPVISVNCESGPAEIIINEQNGLLVENYNTHALADAINRFADDDVLYDICKSNAVTSVEHLSLAAVSKQWQNLMLNDHNN